ncbi:hypothetical protein LJ657_15975 [Streptomyces sp. NR30]|uniref:Uncharacterized protein n=1 Tax=Streptomyces guryensis TaxID=2886947 RepID=A0A9Q3Z5Q0_9ACTN|nr:hypothetical protein [Streptomyces guryensis]
MPNISSPIRYRDRRSGCLGAALTDSYLDAGGDGRWRILCGLSVIGIDDQLYEARTLVTLRGVSMILK